MTTLCTVLKVLLIASCLTIGGPSISKETVSQEDLATQKELLQVKLDANKELQQKDLEAANKRIEALDKRLDDQVSRVSDIGSAVDRFGFIAGLLGLMITVLLAAGGLVGYFSAIGKARKEAEEAAKKWFSENDTVLRQEIETLQTAAKLGHSTIDASVEAFSAQAKTAMEKLQYKISNQLPDGLQTENGADTKALQQRSEELRSIPEANYSFDDWNTRAFAAYNSNQLEEAALFWEYAARTPAVGAVNSAQSIYNRGVALSQLGRHEEAIAAYDQVVAAYSQDPIPALREQVARAMNNRGVALGQQERHEEALAAYEQVITAYSQDSIPALREQVAKAMSNSGIALGKLGRHEQAYAICDKMVALYGQDSDPELRELVARTESNRGVALGQLGRHEEAIVAYDKVIALDEKDSTPALCELVPRVKSNKAIALGQLGRHEAAIDLCDQIIARHEQNPEPAQRELVAKTLSNRAVALGQLGRHEDAIAAQDKVIAFVGQDSAPTMRELVARATNMRGVTLGKLGRHDLAASTFEQMLSLYGQDSAPELQELIAGAMNGKGFHLLCQAKSLWNAKAEAQALLEEAAQILNKAHEGKKESAFILGNQAYVAWLQDAKQQSADLFVSALAAPEDGGEALYKGTLADFEIHPIPEDQGFRELVERLWAEFQADKNRNH